MIFYYSHLFKWIAIKQDEWRVYRLFFFATNYVLMNKDKQKVYTFKVDCAANLYQSFSSQWKLNNCFLLQFFHIIHITYRSFSARMRFGSLFKSNWEKKYLFKIRLFTLFFFISRATYLLLYSIQTLSMKRNQTI